VKMVECEVHDLPVRHRMVVSKECDIAVRDGSYRHVELPGEIRDVRVLLYTHRMEARAVGSSKDLLPHDVPSVGEDVDAHYYKEMADAKNLWQVVPEVHVVMVPVNHSGRLRAGEVHG